MGITDQSSKQAEWYALSIIQKSIADNAPFEATQL